MIRMLCQSTYGKLLEQRNTTATAVLDAGQSEENRIAVNIRDMLERWSDHKVYSNLHRVRLSLNTTKSRYSIACFAQSDKSTLLTSQTCEPITAGDYFGSRISANRS